MSFDGKILIVDDEAHVRKFLGLIVKQLGTPQILEAANGRDAFEIYQQEKPALVLMDVNMPVQDGIETLKQISRIDGDAIVVMLTSLANRATVDAALQGGAVGYLRKDTPKDEILAGLKDLISRYLTPNRSK